MIMTVVFWIMGIAMGLTLLGIVAPSKDNKDGEK